MQKKQELTTIELYLPDEEATIALASGFAPLLCGTSSQADTPNRGGTIHLRGDLGAGKTSFVRGLLRAAGITGKIKSPSYTLLESYNLFNLYFYHLDFYRFSDPREWLDAGFRDILRKEAIILIEWPEQAGALLPPPDLEINLRYVETGRLARLTAHSNRGQLWLTTLAPLFRDSFQKRSPDDAS